jgi:tRNA uridine 5-carbamoylmethylation protein Kti12
MDLIVHINGWPGCGKLTIARILAKRLSAKLMDNHTLLNPAEILFERADPLHSSLRKEIRSSVLDHAARMQAGVSLIFTDALSDDASDQAFFDDYRALTARRGARLVAVVLECAEDENVRRLVTAGRSDMHKLTRPEVLASMRSRYRLLRPEGLDCIDLDITALSAEDAASAIASALSGD